MLSLAEVPSRHEPNALAIDHGEQRWSWAELDRRSAQWCAWLLARGVTPDDLAVQSDPVRDDAGKVRKASAAIAHNAKRAQT
jgi:bile acid-coenzyme A ligase